MLDMNKHIVKDDDSKPFHTSGYAVAANGNRMGSTSTTSFERRLQIDQNRRKIGNYDQSVIGRSRYMVKARTVDDINNTTSRTPELAVGQRTLAPPGTTAGRAQSYDPYA